MAWTQLLLSRSVGVAWCFPLPFAFCEERGGGVLGGGVAFAEAVYCFRERTEGVLDLLEFQGLWVG